MSNRQIRSDDKWELLFSEEGIPTIKKMADLPPWACVAFAARCTRRVLPFLHHYWPDIPKEHEACIERCLQIAEGRLDADMSSVSTLIKEIGEVIEQANSLRKTVGPVVMSRCQNILSAAEVAVYATKCALAGQAGYAADNASDAAKCACMSVDGNQEIVQDIRRDFAAIEDAAKASDYWLANPREPLSFYVLHQKLVFTDYNQLTRRLILFGEQITESLIAYLKDNPQELYSMHPRKFEELVAELLSGMNFQVELTSQTVDGGVDVIAIREQTFRDKYLIECKRCTRAKGLSRNRSSPTWCRE